MQDENEKDNEKASATSDELPQTLDLGDGLKLELRNGWYVLPRRGAVVTAEMVKQIQQELDDEEVAEANAFATGKKP